MRINKYIAQSSDLSRRAADAAIAQGRVLVNDTLATPGTIVSPVDEVKLDNIVLTPTETLITIMFNKPVGYVCSHNGQGSKTIYDILPKELHHLHPVGRLDKDSSGLLLLTNDGQLAQQLTHPKYQKTKVYEVTLNKPLQPLQQQLISDYGITLEDGRSQFLVTRLERSAQRDHERKASGGMEAVHERSDKNTSRGVSPSSTHDSPTSYLVTMTEGRNRQIRRTFAALGFTVTALHRTHFGAYRLADLAPGHHFVI